MPETSEVAHTQQEAETTKLKYAIQEYKDKMTLSDFTEFAANFEQKVGVGMRTFYNWCKIEMGDDYFIPRKQLEALAAHMGTTAAKLMNFKMTPKK